MGETFLGRALDEAVFRDCAMAGAWFDDVKLSGACFTNVDLGGASFENVDLADVSIRDARIDRLTVGGHDVAALIAGAGRMMAEPQLFVRDMARALDFYRERLGFGIAFAYGDPAFYAQVRRGGWRLNLRQVSGPVFAEGLRESGPDLLSATLVMDDIGPLHAEYRSAALAFHQPLRTEPWGALTFIIRDPDDNLIAFAGHATAP
jgi:uncharacterized protein YjbI with pentapeptide repeats